MTGPGGHPTASEDRRPPVRIPRTMLRLLPALLALPASALEIEWQPETRVLVAERGAYGRIARLDDTRLLCAYSRRGGLRVKESPDNGRSWGDERRVADWRHGALANAELLVRRDGEVWCLFNRRPSRGAPPEARSSVGFHRSADGGRTWGEPEVIYEAGRTQSGEDGCWEPVGLELPDGELQVYFANEFPYPESNDQEITMLRSRDGGDSWSKPVSASYREGSRDGMPVPLLLPEAKGIAVAIEDNGLRGSFKPVVVASPWTDAWSAGAVDADSPRRRAALAEPLPARAYAGAPYLVRLRRDLTVLSFQLAENGEMRDSRMAVSLGDGGARDFGTPSFPFPDGERQLWNALFAKDRSTVTAVSEATIDGRRGIWTVDGVVR